MDEREILRASLDNPALLNIVMRDKPKTPIQHKPKTGPDKRRREAKGKAARKNLGSFDI